MTAREKIDAARAATTECEAHITNAVQRLSVRMATEADVYLSKWDVELCLAAAIDELKKALRVLEAAPAVTAADYDAARDSETAGEE